MGGEGGEQGAHRETAKPWGKNATIHLAYNFVRCVLWGLWSDRCAGRLRSEITGAPSEFIFQILFFALGMRMSIFTCILYIWFYHDA